MRFLATTLVLLLTISPASALEIQKVTDNIYALIGEHKQRSPENLANNATFGVIITSEGVVLVDPGGSWKGAAAIDAKIRELTDKPVRIVINSGGQDHRWLGNGYWKAKGATIIASNDAVADHKDRQSLQFTILDQLLGDALKGTEAVYADITFDTEHAFSLGGVKFEIHHPGQAHTPGDSFVWVADQKTVFAGDIVYTERIVGIGPQSHSGSWIETFRAMAAYKPTHLIPGHGHATTLEQAEKQTLNYLVNLRKQMAKHIEDGGEMITSVAVDQSAFSHLEQFSSLARRNAQQVFSEMEWE
jgi:glyoxylase-like metal-dependent hydrolase (beta-lactamase superfamily II)